MAGLVALAASPAGASDGGFGGQNGGGGATIGAGAGLLGLPPGDTTGGASGCTWQLLNDPTAVQAPTVAPAPNAEEYVQDCPGPAVTVVWVVPPTGAQAVPAALALVASLLPKPRPMMVPPDNDPNGWTYVQVPTWFWVPSSQWRPVSATATAASGPFTATATTTATPSSVEFVPGDGSLGTGVVSCPGPGVAFNNTLPMSQQGQPCNTYTYHDSSSMSPDASGTWQAAMTIEWHVTWVGTGGTGGTLPDLDTTTPIALSVGEVEALLTPNPQGGT